LRPSFIYGSESWTVESLKKSILSGKFIWVNKGNVKVEMVYVKNVVEAIVKSLTNGKNNGIYNITDHSELTAKEFFSALMATQNITISDRSIPTVIAKPAASIIETIWRVFKINTNPPLTRFELSLLAMNRKYKTEKAIQELGYHPIYSTKQALEEMANNFQKIN
jgi:nucleoside-diphosphate-sugar epimerase